jgi:hypothetical protein
VRGSTWQRRQERLRPGKESNATMTSSASALQACLCGQQRCRCMEDEQKMRVQMTIHLHNREEGIQLTTKVTGWYFLEWIHSLGGALCNGDF